MRALLLICAAGLLVQGCANFANKPPLPKHAALESGAGPGAQTDYTAVVANAEVIYFPSDRAGSGGRGEPAALLLDAMQRPGQAFAIGWDVIDSSQQPLLDQLATLPSGREREEIVRRVDLQGSGRTREYCRSVLRDPRYAAVRHIALRWPAAVAQKIENALQLSPEEERELPRGFTMPAAGLDAYAERTAQGGPTPSIALAFRVRAVAQQFAAERIVQHFATAGTAMKLVVFAHPQELVAGEGVPFYVAQKTNVRQLVLDSAVAERPPARLVTQH
jgi:hypothetical protein